MQEIPIHGIRLLGRGLHGNIPLRTVLDHFRPAGKVRPEPLIPPWRDHINLWCEGSRSQLKPDLVVPFARGPVRNGLGFFLSGDLHHPLGDQRPCDGGS